MVLVVFFFNDTATTEIYTLSLHDALPIYSPRIERKRLGQPRRDFSASRRQAKARRVRRASKSRSRSEEHTSELQSHLNLVCRLLLEKKKSRSQRTGSNFATLLPAWRTPL